jgi:hypothetical protein
MIEKLKKKQFVNHFDHVDKGTTTVKEADQRYHNKNTCFSLFLDFPFFCFAAEVEIKMGVSYFTSDS